MGNLTITQIKAFVPAQNLATSSQFYEALGFEVLQRPGGIAHVRHGDTAFLLQSFSAPPGFARNFQMQMLVPSADDWHRHIVEIGLARRFNVMVGTPQDQPWGMRDFTMNDPGGVLWRIANPIVKTH